jgi:probable HAF family extracellular repeat protein
MRNRVCWIMAVVCLTIFCLAGSLGAVVYHYEDLTLQGFSGDTITAINDSRWIVGYSSLGNPTPYQAFVWRPGVGKTILQNFPGGGAGARAYGINNSGQIVGQARVGTVGPHVACLWSNPFASPSGLYSTSSTASSCAYGINAAGQITGESVFEFADEPHHAARWDTPTGIPTDLGTLGGNTSCGRSINDAGQVAGEADIVDGTFQFNRPCLWVPGQPPQEIPMPTLPPPVEITPLLGSALAINRQGNVLVRADTAFGLGQALFWDHQTGVSQYMSPDWYSCWASGLSDANQVVGGGESFNPSIHASAFSWFPAAGRQDLNQQVVNLPAGVSLNHYPAPVISPKGYISGFDSQGHAYLLTPIASPAPLVPLLLLD